MPYDAKIKVSSRSFSNDPLLRAKLSKYFPNSQFNENIANFSAKSFLEFLGDASGAIIGLEPVTERLLKHCSDLEIVSKFGVGLDNIDQKAAEKYNVTIGWTGGLNRRSVAEMALCFMIGLSRHIFVSATNLLREKDWSKYGGSNLSGSTVGIIGVGFIGKDLIKLLRPFGCKILVNDVIEQSEYYKENNLIECSKSEIYRDADIITVHAPLNDETRELFNADVFSQMKKTAYFINCARGEIMIQEDLKKALMKSEIAGAAIDVFEIEPNKDDSFMELPNLYCTPHTGGSSKEAILGMGESAIGHLLSYFENKHS